MRRKGIAAGMLYEQVERFLGERARVPKDRTDARGAERLGQASTHWQRHTHAFGDDKLAQKGDRPRDARLRRGRWR